MGRSEPLTPPRIFVLPSEGQKTGRLAVDRWRRLLFAGCLPSVSFPAPTEDEQSIVAPATLQSGFCGPGVKGQRRDLAGSAPDGKTSRKTLGRLQSRRFPEYQPVRQQADTPLPTGEVSL